MKQPAIQSQQLTYNDAVQEAYFKILKQLRNQLATIEREELRYTLIRKDENIIHEFVNPLCYLRLECRSYGLFGIYYGIETFEKANEYSAITASFVRFIYKLTSKESTALNIENCVRTDWMITNASELYEYIEERQKHHTFALIKHRVTASQRKRMLSVA